MQAGKKESTINFNKLPAAKCGISATVQKRGDRHTHGSLHPLSGSLPRPLLGAHEKNCRQNGRPERTTFGGADVEISGHCRKNMKT